MATSPWLAARSQKATAKTANSRSAVRTQKRRKKRPAMRYPIVIRPETNCVTALLLLVRFPDESEEQNRYRA
jgi:hypothetical protein